MKKLIVVLSFLFANFTIAQEVPKVLNTTFSKEALAQKVTTVSGKTITISKILEEHKGKILVLDLWASWCRDCLNAMPKAKELEEKNREVNFVICSKIF